MRMVVKLVEVGANSWKLSFGRFGALSGHFEER